jgi:hypothetical protein
MGLGAIAGVLLVVAPGAIWAALPLLLLAICPLSMVLLMRGMNRASGGSASPSTPAVASPPSTMRDTEAELAKLRAEVDQLKAERAGDGALRLPND